jgi:hypothetical protein
MRISPGTSSLIPTGTSRNSGAIAFYKAMGMNLLGKIPGYYGDDDALILVLDQGKENHEI